jgi:hypothetical protein
MRNFDMELLRLYSVQTQIKEGLYLHAHSRNLAVIDVANQPVEKIFSLNSVFKRSWPINKLSTNIFAAGKKVKAFHG